MTAVALGPNGKVVELPDEMLAQYDSGKLNRAGLMDYAITTGQGRPEDFGLDKSPGPDIRGPFNAMMISAGKETTQLGSNALQLADELIGNQAGAQRQIAKQAEADRLTAPVGQQYPKASFAGKILPNFAVPGGVVPQVAAGMVQGGLSSDSTAGRLGGAAFGGALAYGGQKGGDYLSRQVTPRIQQMLGSSQAGARETLESAGVPLTIGQRGSSSGRFVDVLKSTILRRQPLENAQLRALTRSAAEVLGEKSDDLTKPVLNRAANRIGDVYESIAQNVGAIDAIGPESAARFAAIDEMLASVPDPSKVNGAINMVNKHVYEEGGKSLTGTAYNALRQRLGRISNQLWDQGSGLEAEVVDELIGTLDDALARSAPEAAEKLSAVRPQWKFLVALRRGASVDDKTGLINPAAMNKAMESVYQGFDIGKGPSGAAGKFGSTLDAFRQVITPYKSSGTAERLTGLALPALAGLGLTGMAGPIAGPAAMLALALSGGGAGGQLGGGLARSLAQQAQPQTEQASQLARRLIR